jgi:hypothetical protein
MPFVSVVRHTGAVQARPDGAGGVVVELGGADVVEVVVEVVAVVVEVVEVVEVVDVDGDVVGDVLGEVVGEVVGDVVGAGPSQVTAITVGLTGVYDSVLVPQPTLMLPPTGRAIASAGIAAGGRGSTESPPVTATLPRRAGAAFFPSVTVSRSRVLPLTTRASPLRTTVCPPLCRDRIADALSRREPSTDAADVATGAVSRAPANPAVIIDTRAAGNRVARGEVSPEVAVRYQAERRRPARPTLS